MSTSGQNYGNRAKVWKILFKGCFCWVSSLHNLYRHPRNFPDTFVNRLIFFFLSSCSLIQTVKIFSYTRPDFCVNRWDCSRACIHAIRGHISPRDPLVYRPPHVFFLLQVPCPATGGRGRHDSALLPGAPHPTAGGTGAGEAVVHEEPGLHKDEEED